ncbi:MAG: hypothetical protein MUE50_19520 [Pirellulaceae bacterium]|nr:hypothetical protein [Pirellulaceae bacterium]
MKNLRLHCSLAAGFLLVAGGPSWGLPSCAGADTEGALVPLVQPWRQFALDPEYSGAWVVAGDLDGDGAVETVSARNVDRNDVHYTSAAVAQRLDGSVLWRWGDPAVGRKKLHHDVACQIYDWDGDGCPEVVLCTEGFLVELDGATGRERRRFPLPKDASDCLVFANLSGGPRATDVLVKTRYTQIWAFHRDGRQLWTIEKPGGYLTAHQPVPIDLDGDGRDEIAAGYAMLNADGRDDAVGVPVAKSRPKPGTLRLFPAGARRQDPFGVPFRDDPVRSQRDCVAGRERQAALGTGRRTLRIDRRRPDLCGPGRRPAGRRHRPPSMGRRAAVGDR